MSNKNNDFEYYNEHTRPHGGWMTVGGDDDWSVNTHYVKTSRTLLEGASLMTPPLDRYPDYGNDRFCHRIAKYLVRCKDEQVCGGAGASELIVGVVRAVEPRKALLIEPCFSGYRRALDATRRCETRAYALRPENAFMLQDDILDYLTPDLDIFFVTNPNNPTGRLVPTDLMRRIIERCEENKIACVVDESYLRFCEGAVSATKYIDEFRYLYVIESFTKYFACPSARIAYMVGEPGNIKRVAEVLPEWNMSALAQALGISYAFGVGKGFREFTRVAEEREYLVERLKDIGIFAFPSEANFVLTLSFFDLTERALEKNIILRSCANFRALGPNFTRIVVKREKDIDRLVDALDELVAASGERTTDPKHIMRVKDIFDACKTYGGPFVNYETKTTSVEVAAPSLSEALANVENVAPGDIEAESFRTIEAELEEAGVVLPADQAFTTKRVVHTTADFEYVKTMKYSPNATKTLADLIRAGAYIVTDTNMALAGINKTELAKYGAEALCFMADPDVAEEAKRRGITRAAVSMERAVKLDKPVVFVVGNAPTALVRLSEMIAQREYLPAFIVGVPVGFVNVVNAKELTIASGVPYIVNVGRKGGSTVAAAICNSVLYEMRKGNL